MKEAKYIREDKTITNLKTGMVIHCQFTNEAKRKSREIQMKEDGALGRGSVLVG